MAPTQLYSIHIPGLRETQKNKLLEYVTRLGNLYEIDNKIKDY